MNNLNAIAQHRVEQIQRRSSSYQVTWDEKFVPSLEQMALAVLPDSTPTQDLCTLAQIVGKDEPKNL